MVNHSGDVRLVQLALWFGPGAGQRLDVPVCPCACARRRPASTTPRPSLPESNLHSGKPPHEPTAPSVLVVFADHAGCPWLRALRRGYRHCFVVLRAGSVWLACEPLKDRIELDALDLPSEFDLAAFYREQGHRVLLGQRPLPRTRRRFALAPLTCVTVVKRLLGIDAPWVWTPWQLYSHLSGPELGFRTCVRATSNRRTPQLATAAGTRPLTS
jgi:hypothetical protein